MKRARSPASPRSLPWSLPGSSSLRAGWSGQVSGGTPSLWGGSSSLEWGLGVQRGGCGGAQVEGSWWNRWEHQGN